MFFKRKKLREIEEKIDGVQQILERQAQEIKEMQEQYQRLLCEFMNEKMACLADENRNMIEAAETKLKDAQTNILSAVEENTEEIKQWRVLQESRNKEIEDALNTVKNSIRNEMKKERQMEKQIADKLDLTENEIRMLLLNSVLVQFPQDIEAEDKV